MLPASHDVGQVQEISPSLAGACLVGSASCTATQAMHPWYVSAQGLARPANLDPDILQIQIEL